MQSTNFRLYIKRLVLAAVTLTAIYIYKEFIVKLIDYSKKYDVTVIGSVGYADGMHRQPIDHLKLFDKYLKVNGIVIRNYTAKFLNQDVLNMFNRGNQLGRVVVFEDTVTKEVTGIDDSLQMVINSQLFKVFTRNEQIFIAYSMFESDAIPDVWVERMNKQFDMVVVPDPYFIEVYKNSGVQIPIFFLPLGIDLAHQLQTPLKTARNKKFVYANLGQGIDRKNQLKLLQAFAKIQLLRDDTYLILHSRFTFGTTREEILSYLRNNNIKNVKYTVGQLSPDSYNDLLKRVDCFVYPSKGEGFAIQPREAMTMGIPTIITNNTAQQTICDSGLAECIDSTIKRSAYYEMSGGIVMGNNFDCSVEDIAAAMLKVYDNYDEYLKYSEKARNWASYYSYDNLKTKYLNMVRPVKVILGEKNEITDEYLMTNSQKLYNKYKKISLESLAQ